jgi:asparagine synthase (glutamine-hydrolysing)
MCGICGAAQFTSGTPVCDKDILARMRQTIYHRGPNDEGYYLGEQAMLGMRRLSIIDPLSGQQPITDEDETIWLVFNGEIYNFREIRVVLEAKGHVFRSNSDSEVILHAYEEYGDDCIHHFNGMFAFAIWDEPKRRLLLVRDRLGIKPLYYWYDQGTLIFGSEIKAILAHPMVPREIDLTAIDHFLTLEYIPGPRTIFRNINKLNPGHKLVFQNGELNIEQYWDIPVREITEDADTCAEMLFHLLKDAVEQHLVSDVPLGAFLSGGIDSSTIVALMSQITPGNVRTFSIGFEDSSYNELPYARAVAEHFGTIHSDEVLEPDIAGMAQWLVGHMDEPFGDFSMFPTYLVSQLASRQVKVVLSGDGGDELFGGYDTYIAQRLDSYYRRLPTPLRQSLLPALMDRIPPQSAKKGLINKAKRLIEGSVLPPSLQHTRWMMFTTEADKALLYRPDFRANLNGSSPATLIQDYFHRAAPFGAMAQQQYVDIKTYLVDDILTKVDRMSMAASIEARVPLLDHRIVEMAVNLPAHMKLQRSLTKVILRKAMKRHLPEVVLKKPKQGFSIPVKTWLRGPLKPLMTDLLSGEALKKRGYFEPQTVNAWMREHLEGRANHSHRLWALMVLELWTQTVLEGEQSFQWIKA